MNNEIDQEKFQLNLKFYFFLKMLVKIKFSPEQINKLLGMISSIESLKEAEKNIKAKTKIDNFNQIIDQIHNDSDLRLFCFALRLICVKPLLLKMAEAQIINNNQEVLRQIDPLSLEYDKQTTFKVYSIRVEQALLSLQFFENPENGIIVFEQKFCGEYMQELPQLTREFRAKGIETNQIFMLMFNESLNQSIRSKSGSNYEDRIKARLIAIGIDENQISKKHDEVDSSTEFDFFLTLEGGKTYGISAKRTLRERYKQFIKTPQMSKLDVMIEITLGEDLTEKKAKAIRKHEVYLFVADEVYQRADFLQKIEGVYSVKDLNLEVLNKLGV